jgi:hypothetical protein
VIGATQKSTSLLDVIIAGGTFVLSIGSQNSMTVLVYTNRDQYLNGGLDLLVLLEITYIMYHGVDPLFGTFFDSARLK